MVIEKSCQQTRVGVIAVIIKARSQLAAVATGGKNRLHRVIKRKIKQSAELTIVPDLPGLDRVTVEILAQQQKIFAADPSGIGIEIAPEIGWHALPHRV